MTPAPAKRIVVAFRIPEALRDVLAGITDYAKHAGCNWHVLCVDPDEFESTLARHRADGAITVVPPRAGRMIRRLVACGIPVVNMTQDLTPHIPSVLSDDPAIGAAAARYLLEKGFRRTAFVGVDSLWSRNRQAGFAAGLRDAGANPPLGIPPLSVADFRFPNRDRAHPILRRWLRRLPRPVGILAACDFVARALVIACQAEKLDVPAHVAIIGVDNFHTICELSPVPISSIPQDFVRMGGQAAALLASLMARKRPRDFKAVLIPPGRIVVRQSTDSFAFEDEWVIAALRLIHSHAATGITMSQLLSQVPWPRKWLDQRFKKVVGHSASREIRRCRMAYVRNLLVETDMPLKQIAARCNFSCMENLIRCFRAAHGAPPHAYRLKHRAPPAGAC